MKGMKFKSLNKILNKIKDYYKYDTIRYQYIQDCKSLTFFRSTKILSCTIVNSKISTFKNINYDLSLFFDYCKFEGNVEIDTNTVPIFNNCIGKVFYYVDGKRIDLDLSEIIK